MAYKDTEVVPRTPVRSGDLIPVILHDSLVEYVASLSVSFSEEEVLGEYLIW